MSDNFYQEAWNYALNEIHTQYKNENKEREFLFNFNMNYVEDNENKIIASVPSNFMMMTVKTKGIISIVENKIREVTGQPTITIECIISNDSENSTPTPTVNPVPETTESTEDKPSNPLLRLNIEPTENDEIDFEPSKNNNLPDENIPKEDIYPFSDKFTFESFVPGDINDYPYKAAIAVAQNPGEKYNPILFYGGSGLGKTHLTKAIGNYIALNNPNKLKICYVSAETFVNEFTKSLSISPKKLNEFKEKYRNTDVLLLDDIQFLHNKPALQDELFFTFEALSLKKSQMVFTCDKPIKEINNMTSRLVSRLSNGWSINLDPPNYETRIAIILKKIQMENKTLEPEVIDYIAKNVETNVRELEAALHRIFGYAELTGNKPTLQVVKSQLKDIFTSNGNEKVSVETIQKVVAKDYNLTVADLKSPKRDKKFVIPRQIAMYIVRNMTELSLIEIGSEFGGKDHTTIMHAIEKIEENLKTDPLLESRITSLKKEIKEFNNKN